MTEYLTVDDVLRVAAAVLGEQPLVRDWGLLASAVARPQASAFGQDAYPDIHTKAAALFQSLACNHSLVDGNKRTGLNSTVTFLDINGWTLLVPLDDDKVESVALDVAESRIDVAEIAAALRGFTARL